MKGAVGAFVVIIVAGCGPQGGVHHGSNGNASDGGVPGGTGGNGNPLPMPDLLPLDPNADYDHDGTSIAQGDCNDFEPLIGPNAVEVTGNMTDDDCDGMVDEVESLCDSAAAGKTDAPSLAQAIDSCDSRFLVDAKLVGPSDVRGRAIVPTFGVVGKKQGAAMVLLSTGLAVDKMGAGYVKPQIGTTLNNTSANPDLTVPAVAGCSSTQPAMVNDYTELSLKLKVPQNANSFSFQFHFFSAEYPEFVCTKYNDEFLVEMTSPNEYPTAANISFDSAKNPITVNNGLFTICENYTKPQTMQCTKPVSDIAGTGYEDPDPSGTKPTGGSTGWLTTTAPVTPGEEVTLRFIIFDEGDFIYDSAVLIDNFQWSVKAVNGPSTIP